MSSFLLLSLSGHRLRGLSLDMTQIPIPTPEIPQREDETEQKNVQHRWLLRNHTAMNPVLGLI